MRKFFSVFLVFLFLSPAVFADETRNLVRGIAAVAGMVAIEKATVPRAEHIPEEPVQAIDRACIKPAIIGGETTVVIRSVRGAAYYPVRDRLISALQESGYTLIESGNISESGRGGTFASGGQNLSDFLRSVYGNGPGFEAETRDSTSRGDLPKADYYLELTTSWVSGESNFQNLAGSAFGYYGNYYRRGREGELRISIVLFDSENRAVPGKVSEAIVHLSLRSSRGGGVIAYYFGDFQGSFQELRDPATEATIRIIPKMFGKAGAR